MRKNAVPGHKALIAKRTRSGLKETFLFLQPILSRCKSTSCPTVKLLLDYH